MITPFIKLIIGSCLDIIKAQVIFSDIVSVQLLQFIFSIVILIFFSRKFIFFKFKVSKRSSFEKIEAWINENEKCDIPIKLLVGNKVILNEMTEE